MTLLAASLGVRRGTFALSASLDVAAGEVVALLGPNGAGKSTALRSLAGLLALDSGSIVVDGAVWDAPAADVFVPARARSVGVVFQDYLLFPHLSALDNVAFGLRTRGLSTRAARAAATRWLDRFGLGPLGGRRPARLSGGQAQRVALARALAPHPRLLLLDEPLAALDAATRQEVRADLRHHLASPERATVVVTHDPLDAMVLADRIVVLESGTVTQSGTPAEITRFPRTDYIARLVGLNLYRGAASGHVVTLPNGTTVTCADSLDGPAFVAFAPAAVALHRTRPDGSPRNLWPATVTGLERHGDNVRVRLDGDVPMAADVTAAGVAALSLTLGTEVWAAVKATETKAYSA
ncbi:ABC transporter ATP-binding protein [Luedemannella helvata]|uniref:ABC transporter ATP-binding protein n=1 Tax=Luedemannella helvata TaxID=349315 RepID=A0ABP4VPW3_9ACTN